MSPPPYISVVMAVYNGAEVLAETMDSVLGQTETDFEFIVVNDGSTEAAVAEMLSEYARRDCRVRIMTKSNEGLTKALIVGCSAAKGKYIARIDNGDVMSPERLGKQRNVLDAQPDVAFVSCWTQILGPEWELLSVQREKQTGDAGMSIIGMHPARDLLSGPTHHSSVTFRARDYHAGGGYRPQFYFGQDWDLWYRLAEQGRFHQIPEILHRVRLFPDGISSQAYHIQKESGRLALEAFRARQMGQEEQTYLQQAARLRPGAGRGYRCSRMRRAAGLYVIGKLLLRNRDSRCYTYFIKSLKEWPFYLRAWFALVAAHLCRLPTGDEHQ